MPITKTELLEELKVMIESTNPAMAQLVPPGAEVESSFSRTARHNRYRELWRKVNEASEGDPIIADVAAEIGRV